MSGETDLSSGFAQDVDAMTLARAQRGDMQAFAALYRRYGRACFNLALRILGNTAQAEDIVQEVFVKMMDTIRGYRGEAPFGAWLKRMAVNATIDQLRGQRRLAEDDPEALFASTSAELPAPEYAVDTFGLLQRLPLRARTVLVLHELEGYTHKELATLFGQTESYSKSILARALKRLHVMVMHPPEFQDPKPCLGKS